MAERTSLREFQRELAARLAEARAETAPHARLGLQAGGRSWLMRLDEAGEVLPIPAVTPVPLTRAWFLGLANVRGNLASIVDLAQFVGQPAPVPSADGRLVLFAERFGAHSGLAVERLIGLRNIHEMQVLGETPEHGWIRTTLQDRDGSRWWELDVAALVAHGDFLQAGW